MTPRHGTTKATPGPAARERAALAALLAELGPDASTLCQGWDTRHLAAHLVARETRFSALPGILVPALHARTARVEDETQAAFSYEQLVRQLASGPPLGRTLLGIPGLVDPVNVHEFFVHHEDVRRAQPGWQARELDSSLLDALWRRLVLLAPFFFGRLNGAQLRLATPDGRGRLIGHGPEEVTVTGPVPELFLYAFGRRTVAEVSITGSVTAQAKLAAVDLRQ